MVLVPKTSKEDVRTSVREGDVLQSKNPAADKKMIGGDMPWHTTGEEFPPLWHLPTNILGAYINNLHVSHLNIISYLLTAYNSILINCI